MKDELIGLERHREEYLFLSVAFSMNNNVSESDAYTTADAPSPVTHRAALRWQNAQFVPLTSRAILRR